MTRYCTSATTLQFSFFRFPRFLLQHPYRQLSNDAKLLYCFLLDRTSLSMKNGWNDALGRVYVIFPRSEVMELLGVSDKTATKLFQELQGCGLIDKLKSGRCQADKIFVAMPEEAQRARKEDGEAVTSQSSQSRASTRPVTRSTAVTEAEECGEDNIPTVMPQDLPAGEEKFSRPEVKIFRPNNTNYTNTDQNHTPPSSLLASSVRQRERVQQVCVTDMDLSDHWADACAPGDSYPNRLSLELEQLKRDNPQDAGRYDDLFSVVCDMVRHPRPLSVSGIRYSASAVRQKFLHLSAGHLEGVLYAIDHRDPALKIRSYQAYVTALLMTSVSVQQVAFEDYFRQTYRPACVG